MLHIIRSSDAKSILREIYVYTRNRWGARQADAYHRQFAKAFDTLADNPHLGRTRPNIPDGYRLYPVGSHFIVYRTHAKHLYIVTILHMSMEVEHRLSLLTER